MFLLFTFYYSTLTTPTHICFSVSGLLDLILNFPGYHRWRFSDVLRNVLKLIVSFAWVIVLPICYVQSSNYSPVDVKGILPFLPKQSGIPPLYLLAVALYLLPNLLAACLFLFPMLRRWIENSDWHIIRLLLWWSQVSFIPAFVVSIIPTPPATPSGISYLAKYIGSILQSINCSETN